MMTSLQSVHNARATSVGSLASYSIRGAGTFFSLLTLEN